MNAEVGVKAYAFHPYVVMASSFTFHDHQVVRANDDYRWQCQSMLHKLLAGDLKPQL